MIVPIPEVRLVLIKKSIVPVVVSKVLIVPIPEVRLVLVKKSIVPVVVSKVGIVPIPVRLIFLAVNSSKTISSDT